MINVDYECPHCKARFDWGSLYALTPDLCPKCGKNWRVPKPSEEPEHVGENKKSEEPEKK